MGQNKKFNLPPHVLEMIKSLKEEPLNTTEENKVFDFLVPFGEALLPCEAWFARAEGDITFTRVIIYPGTENERIIDIDKVESEWIDVYSCEPSPWTMILGPAIDLRIKEEQLK